MSSVRYKYLYYYIAIHTFTQLPWLQERLDEQGLDALYAEAVEADGGILSQGGTQGFDHGQQQHQLTELADHYVWVEKSWLHCSLHAPYAYLCPNNLLILLLYLFTIIFRNMFFSLLYRISKIETAVFEETIDQSNQRNRIYRHLMSQCEPSTTPPFLLSRLALVSSTPVSPGQRAQKDDR